MTEPKKNPRSSKKKATQELVEVAKKIDKSVVKEAKAKVVEAKPSKKEVEEIVPVAVAPVKRPDPDIKVKAVSSVRGIIGNYRYEIEKGKVYTFPAYVANFLIQQGRAI